MKVSKTVLRLKQLYRVIVGNFLIDYRVKIKIKKEDSEPRHDL